MTTLFSPLKTMKLQLANAFIDKVTTMKDRSLKITLVTRELPAEEMSKLFDQLQQESELEFDIAPEEGAKTKSQRMKAALYRLWEAQYQAKYPEFEVFYNAKMDGMIDKIKDLID